MMNRKQMMVAGLAAIFLVMSSGCNGGTQNAQGNIGVEEKGTQNTQAGTSTMVSGGITEQEAKNIAIENAGIAETDLQYITVKQDWDDGCARYDVDFLAGNVEYDYELDASNGTILSADSERLDKGTGTAQQTEGTTQQSVGVAQSSTGNISIDAAKEAVMAKVPGIDAGNIYIHEDYDDGILLYEGEAYHAEVKYEFEINAATGSIVSWEAESIYD